MPDAKNLTIRRQVQNRHIRGTMEHERYVKQLEPLGLKPSVLDDEIDPRKVVQEFHGKGELDPNPRDNSPREIVDLGRLAGQYWDDEKHRYANTTCLMIVYSKRGTHIYPVQKPRR